MSRSYKKCLSDYTSWTGIFYIDAIPDKWYNINNRINEVSRISQNIFEHQTKEEITSIIKERMSEKNISIRGLADELGVGHPHIIRMMKGYNYTIDTLLKILDAIDLEITVKQKEQH